MSGPAAVPDRVARIGAVARWKPVHLGHQAMLEALCARADHAFVGIGSANRYDERNPFTADETREMIDLALAGRSNYTVLLIEDLGDGPRWRELACRRFGALDLFVTANGYVKSLLEDRYPVVHPLQVIDPARRVRVDGTMVREAMARGEPWDHLVPSRIAQFLRERGLVERYRREFGEAGA